MLKLKIAFELIKSLFRPKWKNRADLELYQQKKLKLHLDWVKKHSPFYQQLQHFDFQNLPIMNKQNMMDNFDMLNTQGITKTKALQIATAAEESRDFQETLPNNITVGLSSGTSGNKGIFLATENERAQWVAEVLRRVLPIKIGERQKIAFFLRSNSTLYQAIKSNLYDFNFFDLKEPIEVLISKLADLEAHILIAPPSALLAIAQQKDFYRFKFRKIISVAEVLEKDIQQYLELAFEQTIHQVYQATEGFLGSTCQFGVLHLHEDLILFEKNYIDNSTSAFYPIISDFNRRTQPMIRYELNDILHERQKPCPCGSVFLAIDHIEGRSDDILDFEGKKIFPDFLRYAILLSSDDIINFQVIQNPKNQLLIRLKTKNETDFSLICEQVKNRIEKLLLEREIQGVTIFFEQLEHHDFYNKFRRVINQNKIK